MTKIQSVITFLINFFYVKISFTGKAHKKRTLRNAKKSTSPAKDKRHFVYAQEAFMYAKLNAQFNMERYPTCTYLPLTIIEIRYHRDVFECRYVLFILIFGHTNTLMQT